MNEYLNIFVSKYPNISVSKNLTQKNIRIYSYQKNDTNEYPIKYLDHKYLNIQIYSSHFAPHPLGPPKLVHQKWILQKSELPKRERLLQVVTGTCMYQDSLRIKSVPRQMQSCVKFLPQEIFMLDIQGKIQIQFYKKITVLERTFIPFLASSGKGL